MIHKVLEVIEQFGMISYGDRIIVAVSGGPDSMCLLHVLNEIKQKFGLSLYAAHVNHCLRGEEADKDQLYVEGFCKGLGIQCFSRKIDINKFAEERHLSSESAGREARYEFFNELLGKLGAQKVALAHNANDQAETVLMRIIRGTGMEGITGIKPVREGIFIRPLIHTSRSSIESYCTEHELHPRIDRTNLESIYARNKIRLELIPYIAENFNREIITVLNRMAETASIDNDYMEKEAEKIYSKHCRKIQNKIIIDKDAFLEHESVLTRTLRLAVSAIKGNKYNLEKVHIYDLINLQKSGTGRKINLPGKLVGYNNYENIEMYIDEGSGNIRQSEEYTLYINGETYISELGIKVSTRLVNKKEKISLKEENNIKYFDFDKIKEDVSIRTRRNGDRFTPFGMSGSKKLKDLFIDLKIAQEERDKVPLICFGEEIAWVVGYRISESYKINKDTRNILEIQVEKLI